MTCNYAFYHDRNSLAYFCDTFLLFFSFFPNRQNYHYFLHFVSLFSTKVIFLIEKFKTEIFIRFVHLKGFCNLNKSRTFFEKSYYERFIGIFAVVATRLPLDFSLVFFLRIINRPKWAIDLSFLIH